MALTVAVMQPYFIPYAGYFRLLAQSDLFVIYDCVQFPRRGWVHRNRLPDAQGELQWLTLPLAYAPQETLIRDLAFADVAAEAMAQRLAAFDLTDERIAGLSDEVRAVEGRPVDYICGLMQSVCRRLDLPWRTIRSSELEVPASFRGQDRILEIVRRVGGQRYLNAPGGRDLYDVDAFAAQGVELCFLDPHPGPFGSILQRLRDDDPAALRAEIAHG